MTLTGLPFYDGILEGLFFMPMKVAEFISPNVHDIGFGMGILLFAVVTLRLIFGWD